MSWSHSKTGTPPEVIESLIQPRGIQCAEPEQGFKQTALDLVQSVLMSYPQGAKVELACFGSQQPEADSGLAINTLSISIKPASA